LANNEQIHIDLTGLADPSVTNPAFYPLYWVDSHYLVMKGGAGSGKSHFAAQKCVEKCIEQPGQHVLVVRKTLTSNRKSTFPLMLHILGEILGDNWQEIVKVNNTEMTIRFDNGSTMVFAGCLTEDDIKRIKSIFNISMIWVEEADELDFKDYIMLVTRLRYKKAGLMQMMITFNPVSVTSWLKSEFFDNPKPNAFIHESTYHDNPHNPPEYIAELEALKYSDPYTYQVYVLNQWGVVGRTIFDMAKVAARYQQLKEQVAEGHYNPRRGYFTYETYEDRHGDTLVKEDTISFIETDSGYISILREPVEGRYYVAGGDTAGSEVGADDKDYFAGQVLDSTTREQMAILHEDRMEDDEYAYQMYCLGWYYNHHALVGIETNFSLVPTDTLEKLQYPNLYMRETVDTSTHRIQKKYGIRTDKRTRPLMIAEGIKLVRDSVEQINDIKTLEEMMTFMRNDKGKPEAQNGKHDDLIMSLCIALYIRSQQDTVAVVSDQPEKSLIEKIKEKKMKALKRRDRSRAQL
jgi:phage terminase large subunit